MKYLLSILLIISAASIITLVYIWPDKPDNRQKIAATVNGHNLVESQLDSELSKSGSLSTTRADSLNSIITRELLIQEAQRQNIDKEESFRTALKTFYEQSLIKILMDRQYSKLKVDVSEEEINRYLSFFGKKITFTRMKVDSAPPHTPISENSQTTEVLFDDLADPLRFIIAFLEPGKHTLRFDTSNEQYAIRLDKIAVNETQATAPPRKDLIKELLIQNKKEQKIAQWLLDLRQNASITIHN